MSASSWILGALFSMARPSAPARQADSIETGENGFTFQPRRGALHAVEWSSIERAVAYRVELYSGELDCLDIHFHGDAKTLSLNEEMPGFHGLMERLPLRAPLERVSSAWESSAASGTARGNPARRSPLHAGLLAKAAPLWPPLADLLRVPRTEAEYRELSGLLHGLNEEIAGKDGHPLASLREVVALLVDSYLQAHPPCPG